MQTTFWITSITSLKPWTAIMAPSDLQPHYNYGVFGNLYLLAFDITKGQLLSKCLFGVIVTTKKPTQIL